MRRPGGRMAVYKGKPILASKKREIKRGNWCRRSTLPGEFPRIRKSIEDTPLESEKTGQISSPTGSKSGSV